MQWSTCAKWRRECRECGSNMEPMNASGESGHSRRRALGLVSGGAAAAGWAAAQERGAGDDANAGVRVYNVSNFGAKGDGATLDTAAFQAAIDACARDQGGTVLAPAGTFVIGTIEMKSNVTLRVAAGAKVLGTDDGKQY